jgi:hypothetical protein
MLEYQRHANEVRARLRNPPNAVADSAWIGKRIVPEIIREERVPVVPSAPAWPHTFLNTKRHLAAGHHFVPIISHRFREGSAVNQLGVILRVVCQHFDVCADDMLSKRRPLEIVLPRHIFMWLARHATLKTLPVIGRFARRDHTTVIHSIQKIDALRAADPQLDYLLTQFLSALRIPPKENSNAAVNRRD